MWNYLLISGFGFLCGMAAASIYYRNKIKKRFFVSLKTWREADSELRKKFILLKAIHIAADLKKQEQEELAEEIYQGLEKGKDSPQA